MISVFRVDHTTSGSDWELVIAADDPRVQANRTYTRGMIIASGNVREYHMSFDGGNTYLHFTESLSQNIVNFSFQKGNTLHVRRHDGAQALSLEIQMW